MKRENKILYMLKHISLSIIFLLLFTLSSHADNGDTASDLAMDSVNYELKPRFGLYGHFSFNLHTANFSKLPNVAGCCPNYSFGTGTGFEFGGLFEYPWDEKLHFTVRLGYSSYDGTLSEDEPRTIIIDGKSQIGIFEHSIQANYGTIGIEPMAGYYFMPDLIAYAGFRIGYLANNHYIQSEKIISPSDRGSFDDGTRERNLSFGDIPDVSDIQFGIKIGAGYHFPMNKDKSLILSPEVFFTFNATPVVKGVSWNAHSINGGVSVKYREPPPPPPPPPPAPSPPFPEPALPIAPPALEASVVIAKVDSLGNIDKNFNIKIEDFVSLNLRPLLTYVFFDSLSSVIPSRYKKLKPNQTEAYSNKNLQNLDALETYYHVLNIVGRRLRDYPEATIKITGCNSNVGEERNNKDLSRDRAITVRDYLRDVWEIEGTRMPIDIRNLPSKATRDDEPGGSEENRRVEITSNDWRITEPVVTIDTLRIISDYDLRFITETKSAVGIKDWKVNASFDGNELVNFKGSGNPKKELDWELNNKTPHYPRTAGNIFYSIQVTDSLGQTLESPKNRLPIEQLTIDRKRLERIKDKEFEYYSLILFDFGKHDLHSEHRKVVDFIKDRSNDKSQIYVRGYTDAMGDDDVNKRLSQRRAKSVADRLKLKNAIVEGIGEDLLLYSNDTPEGRFYCRTVQIIIETPIDD
jgi:outer membrane protein OmpA-like peptidoglycan-associated protein